MFIECLFFKIQITRNLKLEHILLDSKGNSKICGFINCINYSAKKKDENGIFACSYKGDEYLSPEVIKRHLFDHSIDYWALGIIVYRMFTGKFPFLNEESARNDSVPSLDELNISKEAKQFILNLLTKDPANRYGSTKNSKRSKDDDFFNGFKWHSLKKGAIEPPFKPILVKN